ncbi:HD domain-containing protein [Clostridium baratii]
MVNKKDLESMVDGQIVEAVAFVKSYAVRSAKNNNKYIDGMLEMKGSVPFKVWSGATFDELEKYEYQNTVCHISAKVNEYNGTKSLILTSIKALEEGTYDPADFFEEKYQTEPYWKALNNLVVKNCSEAAVNIFNTVIADIKDRFKVEFAARSHHDAVKSGLLAHTYKVTYLMTRVMKLYPNIVKVVDNDLFALGSALHDIGKVYEYTNGIIQGSGLIVSHHTFGVEILNKHKEFIISQKNEEFYYRLLAIIEQHHGEFEETPRAVEAFLIHMVDYLESSFQAIDESYEKGIRTVNVHNFKLN